MATAAERPLPRFDVREEDLEVAIVVTVSGEVDAHSVPAMRAALEAAAAKRSPRLVVDVRRVSYLDSLGITALAQGFDLARAAGASVTAVCGERTAVLLQSLGLDEVVAIVDSRERALAVAGLPSAPAPATEAAPQYRALLRSAREAIESGVVPAEDEELVRLRFALDEITPPS